MPDTNTPDRPTVAPGTRDPLFATLPVLLTSGQVSLYLDVPTTTLSNWRYQGRGPAFVRLGGHVRYRASDVTDWINEQIPDSAGGVPRR